LRVLFIVPPYPVEEYPALATGSMYLASVLREHGHQVEVLDLLISEPRQDKVEQAMAQAAPDLVGITSVSMTFPIAARIASWVRKARPEAVVALGGPHVSFVPERSLRECPEADIVVRGEAEQTVAELAEALERGSDLLQVSGLTFRRDGNFLSTGPRPLVQDLDQLPAPAWDLLPLARYRVLQGKVGVLSSRGCPYGCIFCVGQRMVGRKGRFRRPEKVVDEMEWLARRGFSSVGIDDDLFTLKKSHAMEVCQEIRSRNLPITWHAFARVDTVSPEVLGAMSDAGCTDLLYGVESGSQEVLDRIGKGITLEQVARAVKMGQEAGLRIFASFILGLPGETKESLKTTAGFARSLGCQYGFHVLSPFPGTRIWEEAEAMGMRILTEQWDHYDANRVVTLTGDIEPGDVEAILDEYDDGIRRFCRVQEEKVRLGTASEQDRRDVQRRTLRPLAWEILRQDLLEKHGHVVEPIPRTEALLQVCLRLSQRLPFSFGQVREAMEKWAEEGVLRSEPMAGGWLWRWATNEELISPRKRP
jgi:anaerobic magnesium-protoporphyrin IX monomethyl ester cyclase